MKIQSMAKQLQLRMTLWTAFWFMVLWLVGMLSGIYGAKSYFNAQLSNYTEEIIASLDWQNDEIRIADGQLTANFKQVNSGFYYVIHGQRSERVVSDSLGDFALDLPRRLSSDEMLFLREGPVEQTVLVRFAEVKLGDKWIDIAVAQDVSIMITALSSYAVLFSSSILIMALMIIIGIRQLVSRRFSKLSNTRLFKLEQVQAELFNRRWPLEWVNLVDSLHQALIQIKAKNLLSNRPMTDAYVCWPADLEQLVNNFNEAHSGKQVFLSYNLQPMDLLFDKKDMTKALSSVLANAMEWSQSQAWLEVTHINDRLCITIEDDGQGMDPDRLAQIQLRTGQRKASDENTGLRVLEEVVYAYQGTLNFEKSADLGGLKVRICFARPVLK